MNIASSASRTGTSLVRHSLEALAVSRTSLSLLALPVRRFGLPHHRLIFLRSWGDRESWDHCWRNEESGQEYAAGCQVCILAVRRVFFGE